MASTTGSGRTGHFIRAAFANCFARASVHRIVLGHPVIHRTVYGVAVKAVPALAGPDRGADLRVRLARLVAEQEVRPAIEVSFLILDGDFQPGGERATEPVWRNMAVDDQSVASPERVGVCRSAPLPLGLTLCRWIGPIRDYASRFASGV